MTTPAKVREGLTIARGVFEAFEKSASAASTKAERAKALHTIKKVIGLLVRAKRKKQRGRPKGTTNKYLDIDVQILESEYRYGSVPKAVKAFMDAKLLPVRQVKTHVDRINALKRSLPNTAQ